MLTVVTGDRRNALALRTLCPAATLPPMHPCVRLVGSVRTSAHLSVLAAHAWH
jgi:hypothetical protein